MMLRYRLVIVLVLPLLVAATASVAVADGVDSRELTCVDGTRITATRVTVHRDGVSFEVAGVPMQIPWDLLAGAPFLAERRVLVDPSNAASLREFADWCVLVGLDKEWVKADQEYFRLTSKRLVNPWAGPKDNTAEPPKRSETGASFTITDEDLRAPLLKKLEAYGIVECKEGADRIVSVTKVDYEEVKAVEFFGALLFATYKARCTVQVRDDKGTVIEERKFESGEGRSNTSRDDAKAKCRSDLVGAIASWLAPRCSSE